MKPDWKHAPEWANYLACEANGVWYWYEHKPEKDLDMWVKADGRILLAHIRNWKESLEKRP